ncbi:MAG: transcriptional regulator, partial [Spirochaetia bacterium]|nr:transcriptional regulator [Spirochaetia bacterium]
ETSSDIGKLVCSKRKELGLTQKEAAGLCGVGVRFWSELERGKSSLHLGKVLLVLTRLGLEIQVEGRVCHWLCPRTIEG